MIKVNELRIGNVVSDDSGNVIVDAMLLIELEKSVAIVDPIPLTPEILIKAGFEDLYGFGDEDLNGTEDIELTLTIFEDREDFYQSSVLTSQYPCNEVFLNSEEYKSSRKIMYVHDLQNLYHALTGTELPITL